MENSIHQELRVLWIHGDALWHSSYYKNSCVMHATDDVFALLEKCELHQPSVVFPMNILSSSIKKQRGDGLEKGIHSHSLTATGNGQRPAMFLLLANFSWCFIGLFSTLLVPWLPFLKQKPKAPKMHHRGGFLWKPSHHMTEGEPSLHLEIKGTPPSRHCSTLSVRLTSLAGALERLWTFVGFCPISFTDHWFPQRTSWLSRT